MLVHGGVGDDALAGGLGGDTGGHLCHAGVLDSSTMAIASRSFACTRGPASRSWTGWPLGGRGKLAGGRFEYGPAGVADHASSAPSSLIRRSRIPPGQQGYSRTEHST